MSILKLWVYLPYLHSCKDLHGVNIVVIFAESSVHWRDAQCIHTMWLPHRYSIIDNTSLNQCPYPPCGWHGGLTRVPSSSWTGSCAVWLSLWCINKPNFLMSRWCNASNWLMIPKLHVLNQSCVTGFLKKKKIYLGKLGCVDCWIVNAIQ